MTGSRPMTLDRAARDRAIAYVTKVVDGYEAELRAIPATDAGVAHQAIVRNQLPAWRRRLSLLAGVRVDGGVSMTGGTSR
jgi:hypothetical protein